MQTRAKVGKIQKPSQSLRSGRLAVARKDPANRRYDIWTLAPDSTGSTPPPASRTRKSKKATNNAVPSGPARPQRGRPKVPPRQPEITAAQCPPVDLLPRENHESTEDQRPSGSPASLTTGNRDDVETASGMLPMLLQIDPIFPSDSVSQSKVLDVENLEHFEEYSGNPSLIPLVSADHESSEPSSPLMRNFMAIARENHERSEVETTLAPYTLPIAAGIVERLEVQNQPAPLTSSFNAVPERSEVEVARVRTH